MTDALFLFDPQVDDVPVNSDELHAGWKLTLPAHIKRHAVQAMRLKAGDSLQLSDGNGLRIQAVMADLKPDWLKSWKWGANPSRSPVWR